MHQGQLVFAQLTRHLPLSTFRRCVAQHADEHKVKTFSCLDQFLCMAFAQLTYRESLRDIEACLRAKTQIWIAVSVYVLVAIVKKRLTLPLTLYETLQILSLTLFEQTPLDQLLAHAVNDLDPSDPHNQMNLFE
ncbi:MAG: transposase, family [Gammaproteobacteria bacterium]|nr:transposase, family [Gammaproteobacteria bacterium]